jgi:hypothetical protein
MKPTLKMLLDLCDESTGHVFKQYCENNELRTPAPEDLEELGRILQQAHCAMIDPGGSSAIRDVAEDIESAIATFVVWPKSVLS